ncbi:hypothetical protein Turpa_2854 [Turneriella parva DSM 21527]|uniref:Uncharacterized protein n=2 Tax=Turneriella TaxID=338321 RepID=I4B886_TURPD|nr:hypothetical protein Turpa_2854 [Turneriella parva DSM 21527]
MENQPLYLKLSFLHIHYPQSGFTVLKRHLVLLVVAAAGFSCTAGVAHSVNVVLPTPHLGQKGAAKQFATLFFFTDRNVPDTSIAYNALLEGKTAEALNLLSRTEGGNLPDVQRGYWQNDVAVCFILEGRYREADELLVQAGMLTDAEEIRHNHRISVYLNESHTTYKKMQQPQVVPAPVSGQTPQPEAGKPQAQPEKK